MNSSFLNPANPPQPMAPEQVQGYALVTKQRKLIVCQMPPAKATILSSLTNKDLLVECLQRSPIALVKLDLELGEAGLRLWANACLQTQKPAFLRIPSSSKNPSKVSPVRWWLKRNFDRLVALLLLLLFSPLMLVLAVLIRIDSPGPVLFHQWRVGERGKLFQITKFRTMAMDAETRHHQVMKNQTGLHKLMDDPRVTALGGWLRRYSLDELPQLLNVLRGEMSLVGPRPWALYDAVRIPPELRHRLSALPGMTGAWQVEQRSHLLDLNEVNRGDLKYLDQWSLRRDLKLLLLTVPKVLSGFGAC